MAQTVSSGLIPEPGRHHESKRDVHGLSSELFDPERIFYLLRSKAWLIITIAAIVFLTALAYVIRAPKLYESRAVVQIEQGSQQFVKIQDITQEDPSTKDYLNTIVQAFTSRKLLYRVVKANNLQENAVFAPPRKSGSPYTELELADRLAAKVTVTLRKSTRLVDIVVEDENAELAQALAASFVKEFFRESFEQKFALSKVANEFLQDEADKLKKKLEDSERKLQDYKEKNKAVSLEQTQNIIVEKLRELNTNVTEAKSKRLGLEADIEQLKKIDKNDLEALLGITSVAQLPQVALIREQLVGAETELAQVKERYLTKHPKYIAATLKINNLKQTLVAEAAKAGDTLSRRYEVAVDSESKLQKALSEQEEKALELNNIAIPYNVLQRDVDSDRALYDSVILRLKETGVTQGIEDPPFRVVEEPLAASLPSKPRIKLILALALIVGTLFGAGLVVMVDMFDSSLRTVDEAEEFIAKPVLAAIPDKIGEIQQVFRAEKFDPKALVEPTKKFLTKKNQAEESRKHPIVFLEDSMSAQVEAFRSLRVALSLLGKQDERRTFLFTSAVPSEGKSFTSLNVAYAFAQQGLKTLIIDADLRRPKLKDDLLPNAGDIVGLTDHLSGQATLNEIICKTSHENFYIIPAGHSAPNPAELLHASEFGQLLGELLKDFQRIVVDTPPVHAVSDALIIAESIQTTCLVVRAGKTPKKAILRTIKQLEKAGAKVAGFVFNRLPIGGKSAEYYYYDYGGYYTAGERESLKPK